ncbi:RNA methyltransferase [Fulvivirga lutea]|uniref:RNA methyltransferase n=1 Tax=Fulvivirga lutea TaxID=2810512 RepID=A0A974WIY1_9BACT|nr:RNA methyltransferase [Fulvivirga lutea]QSE99419.1 RNA methyltransferase [Fulvivirga lutea]
MLSKSLAKFIKSLQLKKQRKKEGLFIVEGEKSVNELLQSNFKVKYLVGLSDYVNDINQPTFEVFEANEKTLDSIGTFKSSDRVIAVAEMKDVKNFSISKEEIVLALDGINDPGNLGTIIRLADWYGVKSILASPETADLYNPKVISATKGSFTRVNVYYTDLVAALSESQAPVYGAMMEGQNLHKVKFESGGIIVMGNEANGISPQVEKLIKHKITIPKFGKAESLNVAMATGIILDNVKRN